MFSLAFRITGSADAGRARPRGRRSRTRWMRLPTWRMAVRFGSCLLTAARNAASELGAAGRGRAGGARAGGPPGGRRRSGFEAWQEAAAGGRPGGCPHAARGARAGELEGRSPTATSPTIMDVDAEAVPELVARSRLALHDELFGAPSRARGGRLRGVRAGAAPDGHARRRPAGRQEDGAWLVDHLAHCGECRLRLDAMEQAQADLRPGMATGRLHRLSSRETIRRLRGCGHRLERAVDERRPGAPPAARAGGGRGGAVPTPARARPRPAAAPACGQRALVVPAAPGASRLGVGRLASGGRGRDRLVDRGPGGWSMLLGLSATAAAGGTMLKRRGRALRAVAPAADDGSDAHADRPARSTAAETRARGDAGPRSARRSRRSRPWSPRRRAERPTPRGRGGASPGARVPSAEAVPLPKTGPEADRAPTRRPPRRRRARLLGASAPAGQPGPVGTAGPARRAGVSSPAPLGLGPRRGVGAGAGARADSAGRPGGRGA